MGIIIKKEKYVTNADFEINKIWDYELYTRKSGIIRGGVELDPQKVIKIFNERRDAHNKLVSLIFDTIEVFNRIIEKQTEDYDEKIKKLEDKIYKLETMMGDWDIKSRVRALESKVSI